MRAEVVLNIAVMLQPVAKVTKLFGAERGGGVVVALYAEFPEEFAPQSDPLFVRIDSLDVPLWCDRFERRGATGALVEFADWDTARRAAELVGRELFAEAGEAAPDDEFYMEDLIGFAADVDGRQGEVTDYYDSEANPLLGVTLDGREYLVPAVEEFIVGIDFEGRRLRMTLPDGLLTLND